MRYAFEDYVLDTDRRELRRAGKPIRIEPKVYQVLVYLVQQAERVVSQDELLEHVWPGTYTQPIAVARSITAIRKAVGDHRAMQQVIQTLPRHGYRFVAPVTILDTAWPVTGPGSPLSESTESSGLKMTRVTGQQKVFLAHSSQDKSVVREVFHLLTLDGFQPWLDEFNLVGGQNWELEIKKAIRETDSVVVFLSRQSVDQAGYVQKEITFALDVADRQPEGSIFVVPIRSERCKVPERLRHLHCLELPDDDFPLGPTYLHLRETLATRARERGVKSADSLWSIYHFRKDFPAELYLVRGRGPDGIKYYGTAHLTQDGHTVTLKARIGGRLIEYIGESSYSLTSKEDRLCLNLAGEHQVEYYEGEYGVFLGQWGKTGVEELIPTSPFARRDQPTIETY